MYVKLLALLSIFLNHNAELKANDVEVCFISTNNESILYLKEEELILKFYILQ